MRNATGVQITTTINLGREVYIPAFGGLSDQDDLRITCRVVRDYAPDYDGYSIEDVDGHWIDRDRPMADAEYREFEGQIVPEIDSELRARV